MSTKSIFILISIISINGIWTSTVCEARYLPTRSQEDRLSKLQELLQDVSTYSFYCYCFLKN